MINDKALANRLNAVKGGKDIPKSKGEENPLQGKVPVNETPEEQIFELGEIPSMRSMILSSILNLGEVALMSFFYGFGLQTLFEKHWSILGIFGVGLILNQIISLISSLKLFRQ